MPVHKNVAQFLLLDTLTIMRLRLVGTLYKRINQKEKIVKISTFKCSIYTQSKCLVFAVDVI